jgi:hypothetical protein
MYVPTVAGDYQYHCIFHPTLMSGSFSVISNVGVQSVNSAPLFTSFPNPVSNSLHLQFSNPGAVSVTVTDAMGREVLKSDYAAVREADINVVHMAAGYYFIQVQEGDLVRREQMIVTH